MYIAALDEFDGTAEASLSSLSGATGSADAVFVEASRVSRSGRSNAPTQVHNCLLCGSPEHNKATCPENKQGFTDAELRAMVRSGFERNKAEAKRVARKKYSNAAQAEFVEGRKKNMRDAANSMKLWDIARSSGGDLVRKCVTTGLFVDRTNEVCPYCSQDDDLSEDERGKLAPDGTKNKATDIGRSSVSADGCSGQYRCNRRGCQLRVGPVVHGHPLFDTARSAVSLTLQVSVFWCFVEGLSVTTCKRAVGLGYCAVSRYYRLARKVVSQQAMRLQEAIVFGGRHPLTVDVEADETCLRSWAVHMPRAQDTVYCHLVVVGVVERNSHKLYIRVAGISTSKGASRVPPLKHAIWRGMCRDLFNARSCLILYTDGAPAYNQRGIPGIVEHKVVVHESQEYTRSTEVVRDVSVPVGGCRRKRAAMAGTQQIDSAWRGLKAPTGRKVNSIAGSAKSDSLAAQENLCLHMREGQWRYLIGCVDTWPEFCKAVRAYEPDSPDTDACPWIGKELPAGVEGGPIEVASLASAVAVNFPCMGRPARRLLRTQSAPPPSHEAVACISQTKRMRLRSRVPIEAIWHPLVPLDTHEGNVDVEILS